MASAALLLPLMILLLYQKESRSKILDPYAISALDPTLLGPLCEKRNPDMGIALD